MRNSAQARWRMKSRVFSDSQPAVAQRWYRPAVEMLENRCLLAITLTGALAHDTAPGNTTNSDGLTYDPTISGTLSDANAITSFLAGVNAGPVTYNALPLVQGDHTYTLSQSFLATANGGSLADGVYTLHLKATNSLSQTANLDVTFTLDTSKPTVTVATAAAFTDDVTPHVTVTASDPNGLADGTAVNLDVDLNNDDNFADAGEANRTQSTLYGGRSYFELTPALPATPLSGPYLVQLRARVSDAAGNEGTSPVQELQIDTLGNTILEDYVNTADPSYSYTLNKTITGSGYTAYIYDMISQTWRTTADVDKPVWHHWLQVIVPSGTLNHSALLWIDGGSNTDAAPTSANSSLASLAVSMHSVGVYIPDVPSEPLTFTGDPGNPRTEDDIIAYTFNQYITHYGQPGNDTWPLLLPMVKSAVRAMDTAQSVVPGIVAGAHIDDFVVTGYSKRGWTTWLTAAVDPRVIGIIPGVFDALNLDESMEHQYGFYGFFDQALNPYTAFNIPQDVLTPGGQELMRIVDPYRYLTNGNFNIPKLELNSSGDEFFVPDSAQFYFNDLPGTSNYLRYIPNTGHGLNTTDTAESTLTFYNAVINNLPLPQFSWTMEQSGQIQVQTVDAPSSVVVWQGTNPTTRDFRNSVAHVTYTSSTLSGSSGVYLTNISTPATGATAFFVQLTFPSPIPGQPYIFTTQIQVLSNTPLVSWPFDSPADAPVVDLNGPASGLAYTTSWSQSGPVYVADPANAVVIDSANLTQMTVALVSPNAGDTLLADNSAHPAIALSFASGTLTLSGSASAADYQDVLRTVQYDNTSPPLGSDVLSVNVSATDGTSTSATVTATIDVAPVLDLNGAAAGTSFTSSWGGFAGIPVAITDAANATVSDAGATNLTMLTAALTAPHTGDTLSASNTGHLGIAWSFSGNTLTLSGSDTVANYQAVLRTIKYTNSSGGPLVDSLTVDLQAFDGAIGSNVAVATVTFPPVLDLNGGGIGHGQHDQLVQQRRRRPQRHGQRPRPWHPRASPTSAA